jgi:hypothetical protein
MLRYGEMGQLQYRRWRWTVVLAFAVLDGLADETLAHVEDVARIMPCSVGVDVRALAVQVHRHGLCHFRQ